MKSLSIDLRERIVTAYEQGQGSYARIAERFHVGRATVERLLKRWRTTGSLHPKPHGGGQQPILSEQDHVMIEQWIKETPDLTQEELADRFLTETSRRASPRTMGRARARLGYTRKKRR